MSNVPCRNPKLCGVKSHRPGTQALCQQDSTSTQKASSGNLSATPKLGVSETPASTVELNPEGEAILASVLKGNTREVIVSSEGGTQQIIAINVTEDKDNLFASSDQAAFARIRTAAGLKVYAFDLGARAERTFKDGVSQVSWIHPCDEDGNDLSSQITSDEFRALQEADGKAYDSSWIEEIEKDGELSTEDRNREVIRRILELRSDSGTQDSTLPEDAQNLSDLAKEAIYHNDEVVDYYTNNIVGQYLDQVLQGKGVDQADEITSTDYVGGDDDVERTWGLSDEDGYDWDDYQPALDELEALGATRAQEWLKKNLGTQEFGDWVAARARFNEQFKGASGGYGYGLQQDWAENPLSFH